MIFGHFSAGIPAAKTFLSVTIMRSKSRARSKLFYISDILCSPHTSLSLIFLLFSSMLSIEQQHKGLTSSKSLSHGDRTSVECSFIHLSTLIFRRLISVQAFLKEHGSWCCTVFLMKTTKGINLNFKVWNICRSCFVLDGHTMRQRVHNVRNPILRKSCASPQPEDNHSSVTSH